MVRIPANGLQTIVRPLPKHDPPCRDPWTGEVALGWLRENNRRTLRHLRGLLGVSLASACYGMLSRTRSPPQIWGEREKGRETPSTEIVRERC
jgi:hypothetical protein